jgi:hypothetical protein
MIHFDCDDTIDYATIAEDLWKTLGAAEFTVIALYRIMQF